MESCRQGLKRVTRKGPPLGQGLPLGMPRYCKMCTNIKEIKIKTGTKQEVQAESRLKVSDWDFRTGWGRQGRFWS